MKFTKIPSVIQSDLSKIISRCPFLKDLIKEIDTKGGTAFLVGGAVRDLLRGLSVKDIDIEVHGIEQDELQKLLLEFGNVDLVGKSFGVFKFFTNECADIDISLPRTDTAGRKPEVSVDPFMGIEEAFRRRDLTINAMGINLVTNELVDPFGGQGDLENKILKCVDPEFFVEDPLRFYRVMQFVSRFGMKPDDQLNALCAKMNLSTVSIERIETEFEKMLLKSKQPSLGIRWLQEIGRLEDVFPALYATIAVPQKKEYHPEGTVFEHSMQALDAAAGFSYDNDDEKLLLTYAALCHDLGKIDATREENDTITSKGHEKYSPDLTKQLLKRITGKKDLTNAIAKLTLYHMHPLQFISSDAPLSSYKRLAGKLAPDVTMQHLAKLFRADRLGRNPAKGKPLNQPDPEVDLFIANAQKAEVLLQKEEPVLLGRDLLDVVEPGEKMGELLRQAYEVQIAEGIKDKDELKKRVLNQ